MRKKAKEQILQSYQQYHSLQYLSTDPLTVVHRFKNTIDLEVVALFSALLSYGRVPLIIRAIEGILLICNNAPHTYALNTTFEEKLEHFASFKYRFNPGCDIAILLEIYKKCILKDGSLGNTMTRHFRSGDKSLKETLTSFSEEVREMAFNLTEESNKSFNTLFPSPKSGSACKRLCMFMRWMVRSDEIDFGVWNEIPTSVLIIPLDTHIGTISHELDLTKRKSPDWKCAEEITAQLRKLDKDDPVKYDFSLCRIGILKEK